MRSLLATASGWWRVTDDAIREIGGAEGFQIAFVILAICVVCPVGAAAWQRSHVPPVSYARVDPPQSTKRQDKLLMARAVHLEQITFRSTPGLPWSCQQIRQAAESMTNEQLERLARAHRLSKEQRAEAVRCLKEKRT